MYHQHQSPKDALLLSEQVTGPDGRTALALLHRPLYEGWSGDGGAYAPLPPPKGVLDARASIWISYCPLDESGWLDGSAPARFGRHRLVATPREPWEADRIGGGTVPLRTDAGWLTFYHGVEFTPDGERRYQAGALLLAHDDPGHVLARTSAPIFGSQPREERMGVVDNVVFPTAVEPRAGGLDVYYGMADARIGVVHLRSASPHSMEEVAA